MLSALSYAFAGRRPPDIPPGASEFSYHRGLQPVLWALLIAALLETAVLHLLLARLWSVSGSLLLLTISIAGVIYLIGFIKSLGHLPLLVTDTGVQVRAGLLMDRWLALDDIAAAQVVTDAGDLKRPDLLKVSLLAYPNVLIQLARPLSALGRNGRHRTILTVALRPDDGPAFVAAIAEAKRRTLRV